MSKYGDGKMIIYDLCWSNNEAKLLNSANDYFVPSFFWQKPLDICVEVYRVWCEEASQALQNGTEETITWGRGKLLKFNTLVYQMLKARINSENVLICDICRRSRRRRRILPGEENLSDQSPLVPVETPREHSHPPNPRLTRLSRDPTDTTENLTTRLTNDILAMMVRAE